MGDTTNMWSHKNYSHKSFKGIFYDPSIIYMYMMQSLGGGGGDVGF